MFHQHGLNRDHNLQVSKIYILSFLHPLKEMNRQRCKKIQTATQSGQFSKETYFDPLR